jgi:hypothetical protein
MPRLATTKRSVTVPSVAGSEDEEESELETTPPARGCLRRCCRDRPPPTAVPLVSERLLAGTTLTRVCLEAMARGPEEEVRVTSLAGTRT